MHNIVWYEQVWWQGFKEILSMLGFVTGIVALLYTARTYRRNTETRMQDTDANKVKRTYDVMVGYPGEIRDKVLLVTAQLRDAFVVYEYLKQSGADEQQLNQFLNAVVEEADLVGLLHFLDPYGFLLENDDYLFVDEAMSTFASELSRVLLDQRLNEHFSNILSISTMRGIRRLQYLLNRPYLVNDKRRKKLWLKNPGSTAKKRS